MFHGLYPLQSCSGGHAVKNPRTNPVRLGTGNLDRRHGDLSTGKEETRGAKKWRREYRRCPPMSMAFFLVCFIIGPDMSTVWAQIPAEQPTTINLTTPAPTPNQNEPETPFPSAASVMPSSKPSASNSPTQTLSAAPTRMPVPTLQPSSIPSDLPSDMPSHVPTPEPTFAVPSIGLEKFRQKFVVGNGRVFTDSETTLLEGLYSSYIRFVTDEDVEGRIFTTCEVLTQQIAEADSQRRRLLPSSTPELHVRTRHLQTSTTFEATFSMTFESVYTNVTEFPIEFQKYVNNNLDQLVEQLTLFGLNVTAAFRAFRIVVQQDPTNQPTSTPVPTTQEPSISTPPSSIPSYHPSLSPTLSPTTPLTLSPSSQPSKPNGPNSGSEATIIVVSVVVAVSIVLIGLLVYYRKRKLVKESEFQSNAAGRGQKNGVADPHDERSWGVAVQKQSIYDPGLTPSSKNRESGKAVADMGVIISPSESLVSNQSLLSAGNSMGGDSGDEVDITHNLADEFDQYKDQNLEKMRADVEGNFTGSDSMMSQALTRALIDEDDSNFDPAELLWGGSGQLIGVEIEASALGEVTDWLKRTETPSDGERRLFMQETLNKMVASVRHGVLGPEEASRSIHECAALLGLKLAAEIPVTTLIITGMRKTVTARNMIDAFAEFGEISEAAVASNQRGFGILRFKANQSVDRAMTRFRAEEIVVQDVAVQVKVLRPGSAYQPGDEEVKATPPLVSVA